MSSLFIGVVSHEGSRFSESQGPKGLAARLAAAIDEAGVPATVAVRTEDGHDEGLLPLTSEVVRASLREKLRAERAWQDFLRTDLSESPISRARRHAALAWWRLHLELTLLRPWQAELPASSPARRAVRRLVNIELSHVALLRAGVESGAAWVLILEDDARSSDIADCASGLLGLMDSGSFSYANVSQSHTYDELGITPLMRPSGAAWAGSVPRAVLASSRPVTNTVCAILYRADFVRSLLSAFDELPLAPVVPIDFKLNAALMMLYRRGSLPAGSCWCVDPAPIDQGSMR